MKTSIIVVTAILLTACSDPTPPQTSEAPAPQAAPAARAPETGPCATGFVEIVANRPACGIALEIDGSLSIDGRRTPPITVSYEEGANGKVAIPPRAIVLFPPSPNGLRVVQACETADANSLCWAVRLLDPKGNTLHEIAAGKYGPSHWIRWSPAERRVALISRNEGAEWLHIVDTATGAATAFPGDSENANWKIDRESFAWTSEDAFSVAVKTCESCASETRRFTLP